MDHILTEALKVMPLGQVVVIGLLYFILKDIRGVREQFTKLNGSVGTMKQWQEDHQRVDERFQDEIREQLSNLR